MPFTNVRIFCARVLPSVCRCTLMECVPFNKAIPPREVSRARSRKLGDLDVRSAVASDENAAMFTAIAAAHDLLLERLNDRVGDEYPAICHG